VRPISDMPRNVAAQVKVLFSDIDDTLTTDGRLPAAAYSALEELQHCGVAVAPITGRPAGWCDMIARMWPVMGVVGENGAFYFAYNDKERRMQRAYAASQSERKKNRKRLDVICARILTEVPGAAISADQLFREADLAIDFCEDVEPLSQVDVELIKDIFEQESAVAKVSSIHVNGWFGEYDKLSMSRRFSQEVLNIDMDAEKDAFIFCGDSPNDAPMFSFFPNACGVANVHDFAGRLDAEPAWVAKYRGGAGFVEIAEIIIAEQNK